MTAAFRLFSPDEAPHGRTTVSQIVGQYVDAKRLQMRSGAYSEQRFVKIEFYAKSFCADYGKKEIAACQNADFTHWLLDHPEWVSPHTKSDAVGTIVACFRWAEDERIVDRNPYRRPRGLWSTPQPRQAIDPAEVRAILNFARDCNGKRGRRRSPSCTAFRLALWFLSESGCRTCEMRQLEWDWIDWDAGVARLAKHKTDRTGAERIVPLSDRALRLLACLRRIRSRQAAGGLRGPIYLNGRGRPWTKKTFGKMFRKYADLAGVRKCVSAYCLRHGFTVQALESGVGTRQIADVLGHASTRYVDHYGKRTRTKTDYLRKVMADIKRGRKK